MSKTGWTTEEDVRRAERKVVDCVLGVSDRLMSVTEPYEAELWASVIVEMWHRGTLVGADRAEVAQLRRKPSAMLPRVARDLAVTVIPTIESEGSPRALATLAALAAVAPSPLGDNARAGADRLRRDGVTSPDWAVSVGRANASEALRLVYRREPMEVVLAGFDYPCGSSCCLLATLDDGVLADAAFVSGTLDEVEATITQAEEFSVTRIGVRPAMRHARQALVRHDRLVLAAGAWAIPPSPFDEEVDLPLRALVYARSEPDVQPAGRPDRRRRRRR